jgi:hypothetical protein
VSKLLGSVWREACQERHAVGVRRFQHLHVSLAPVRASAMSSAVVTDIIVVFL